MWWLRFLWCFWYGVLMFCELASCSSVAGTLSDGIRSYYVKEDDAINSTDVNARTLQKEEFGRHANLSPVSDPIRFKEIPDNILSSSSYGHGLVHHDHSGEKGYGLHDFEEIPHYEYHIHEGGHHGGFGPHGPHGHHGHLGYGYHHKHYGHSLASKAILWPLAGIALLGAAAAFVSNPVLLQLGVISGKRRRRDTEEVTGPDYDYITPKLPQKYEEIDPFGSHNVNGNNVVSKRVLKKVQRLVKKAHPTTQSTIETVTPGAYNDNRHFNENRFVPIPLKFKNN